MASSDESGRNDVPGKSRTRELEKLFRKFKQGSVIIEAEHRRVKLHGGNTLFTDLFKWYRSLRTDIEKIITLSKLMDRQLTDKRSRDHEKDAPHGATTCPLSERVIILEQLVEELYQKAIFVPPNKPENNGGRDVAVRNSYDPLTVPAIVPANKQELVVRFTDSPSPPSSSGPKRQAQRLEMCKSSSKEVEELHQKALFVPSNKPENNGRGNVTDRNSYDPLSAKVPAKQQELVVRFTDSPSPQRSSGSKRQAQRPEKFRVGKIILCQCCHERKRGRLINLCNGCEKTWYRHRTEPGDHVPDCTGLMRPQDPHCKTCVVNKIKLLKLKPVPDSPPIDSDDSL